MAEVRGSRHVPGPNVIASLWKVNDVATLVLMVEFYANLWQSNLIVIIDPSGHVEVETVLHATNREFEQAALEKRHCALAPQLATVR